MGSLSQNLTDSSVHTTSNHMKTIFKHEDVLGKKMMSGFFLLFKELKIFLVPLTIQYF